MMGKVSLFLTLVIFAALSAQAQVPDASALKKEFTDKIFYLRDFNQDNSFRITAEGAATGKVKAGPWTTSLIEVKEVAVKGFDVVISGNRLGLLRDPKTHKLVPFRTKKKLNIRVEAAHRSEAWRAYFISNVQELKDLVPAYYRSYLDGKFDQIKAPEKKQVPTDIIPPQAISTPDPSYGELARAHAIQGVCVFRLVVDTEGKPTQIEVERPLGMGLDEQALAALQRWKFKPGQKNGQPAATQINVEVNFRLY
jgi:TonB family protein